MLRSFKDMVARCDLIVMGCSGIITSTGGSINVEVEVEKVLKGSLDYKKIRVAFSIIGQVPLSELKSGERYIFFLQVLRTEDMAVYGLFGDDLNAIIPFNDRILQEIQTLVTDENTA